jgi:hypothetical protein
VEEYRRRLECTEITVCMFLLYLLFGGLLTLPWIGQVIWLGVISAVHIRVIMVIARREKLLKEAETTLHDSGESRSTRCDPERQVVVTDSEAKWVINEDFHFWPSNDR